MFNKLTRNILEEFKKQGIDQRFIDSHKNSYDIDYLEGQLFYGSHCAYSVTIPDYKYEFITRTGIRGRHEGLMTVVNGEVIYLDPVNSKDIVKYLINKDDY